MRHRDRDGARAPVLLPDGAALRQSYRAFPCSQDLLAVQRVPICCDDRRMRIVFPQQSNDLREFLLVHALSMAENDGRRVFHLVIKELSEILHIDFSFLRIDDGCKTVQLHIRKI